jgi:hypothetical protein
VARQFNAAQGDSHRRESGRQLERVAVVAAIAPEAAAAVAVIGTLLPDVELAPATLDAYLASPHAPARVVLCAARGPASRGLAYLRRAAARLLWPAPSADLVDAIRGLRSDHAPRRARRHDSTVAPARGEGLHSALLLEGAVEPARARAALASATRDWIVESVRHVRIEDPGLVALARAGVSWSALEPVELVAVFAAAPLARALRRSSWLPAGTPVWVGTGQPRRADPGVRRRAGRRRVRAPGTPPRRRT